MSSCGTIEFLNGGVIQSSSIISSNITNSTFSAGSIDSSSISNMTEIDATSAQKIVEAIIALDETFRQQLAEALGFKPDGGVEPETSCTDSVSTCVMGSADTLLGKPDSWIQIDGKNIPAY